MKTVYSNFTILGLVFLSAFFALPDQTRAYYGDGCDQYGPMAYASGGYCQCLSGYVFDTSVTGSKYCTDASIVCHSRLGYGSRYNSLSESCECSYGYILGKDSIGRTQCVTPDSVCTDQLGVMSRYNSASDVCECSYGYVISGGTCTSGNIVCHAKNGYNSSYNSLSKRCECDSGYTLDDSNQCVKKQNNVYFKLLDVNTDDRQAIIKSEYDNSQYLITYGLGCYAFSIGRYRNRDLVVNLGTDFDLDTWDNIVLQDDDEVCSIVQHERTFEDSLQVDEPSSYYYVPAPTTPTQTTRTTTSLTDPYVGLTQDERCVRLGYGTFYNTDKQSCDSCPSGETRVSGTNNCQKPTLSVKKVESTPAQSAPVIKKLETKNVDSGEIATTSNTTSSSTTETTNAKNSWLSKLWKFIWRF